MLPKKLKNDAIVEALCELRFDTSTLPELAIGRLIDKSPIKAAPARLPAADIPGPLRQASPDFRYQPWYELKGETGQLMRVGPNMISYHRTGQYVGWSTFRPEIERAIAALYEGIESFQVARIGLRYVNALRKDVHHIGAFHDLRVQIDVAGNKHLGPTMLQIVEEQKTGPFHIRTSIASPDFVQGVLPGVTAVVDVDVATPTNVALKGKDDVLEWVDNAHTYEKKAFFRLFPPALLEQLTEE